MRKMLIERGVMMKFTELLMVKSNIFDHVLYEFRMTGWLFSSASG